MKPSPPAFATAAASSGADGPPASGARTTCGISTSASLPFVGFFEGFELAHVDVGEATLRVRHGGSGPPLVLLHGHPRTHATWHMVAARLRDRFTVVCPDLRGYGESSKV